jgi:hypothetical protein
LSPLAQTFETFLHTLAPLSLTLQGGQS